VSDKRAALSELVRELGPEIRRKLGPSPSPDEIDAYVNGTLSEEQAENVRDHLTWDTETRETILDLMMFPIIAPPRDEPLVSDEEILRDGETAPRSGDSP